MKMLTRADLLSLEQYSEQRPMIRAEIIAHKKNRQIALGAHLRLLFEDRRTIHYQIQEMLRVERIFEAAAIQDELDAYNPLIPGGDNWKATLLIEYEDVDERRIALTKLKGVETRIWIQVSGCEKVFAIADEDMERENADKTASVHFLRFQLSEGMMQAIKQGAAFGIGVDHPEYNINIVVIDAAVRQALVSDLD